MTMKNKGGAPKGNQNARKHGFYSRNPAREANRGQNYPAPVSVREEIALFQAKIAVTLKDGQFDFDTMVVAITELCRLMALEKQVQDAWSHSKRPVVSPQKLNPASDQ